jgi:type IV secretory pathway VirB6-like protein
MNWLKHTLSVLGTIVIVVAFAAALFPTRASALVATLVRDVDNPARDTFQAIFESTCAGTVGALSCTGLTLPTANGSGAAISMVVIEFVSSNCNTGDTILTNFSNAQINTTIGFSLLSPMTSTSGYFAQQLFTPGSSGFSQQTRLYAAPGSTLVDITGNGNGTCAVSIAGYLVTP